MRDIGRQRQEAETTPPAALAPVVARAVELTNRVCWDALEEERPDCTPNICGG